MADTETGDLNPASLPLTGAEEFHLVQGGNSRRATTQDTANLSGGGWVRIVDEASTQEANSVTYGAGARNQIEIDGGAGSVLAYGGTVGTELSNWWKNNRHVISSIGESYTFRLTFRAKKDTWDQEAVIVMEHDTGGVNGVLASSEVELRQTAGIEHRCGFSWAVGCLQEYLSSGAAIFLTPEVTTKVWGVELFIRRDYVPPKT